MYKTDVKKIMKQGNVTPKQAVKLILLSIANEQKTGKPLLSPDEKKELRYSQRYNIAEFRRLGGVVEDIIHQYLICNMLYLERKNTYHVLWNLLTDYFQHIRMMLFYEDLQDKTKTDLDEELNSYYLSIWRSSIHLAGADLKYLATYEELKGVSIMDCKEEIIGLIDKCKNVRKEFLDVYQKIQTNSDEVGVPYFLELCKEKDDDMIEQREIITSLLGYLDAFFSNETKSYDDFLSEFQDYT